MNKIKLKEICPLCNNFGYSFYKNTFFHCSDCMGIFKSRKLLLTPDKEKKRYEEHNNDIFDVMYQSFVSPMTNKIINDYPNNSLGLDFGSGTGPVISHLLAEKEYSIKQYDPFFKDDAEVLDLKYDYIACCEVIEHFHNPSKDFSLLKNMLKPEGRLYCMTYLYNKNIDFDKWFYKNDNTHVFIYQKETMEWIKRKYKFSLITIEDRLITYKN